MTMAVNAERLDLDLEPDRTLADALTKECGLTSTGTSCADGTCGACTVLVDGEATRACLMLAIQGDGAQVRTVEGLIDDPVWRSVLAGPGPGACGVCLPGLVMLAAGAVDHEPGLAADPGRLRRLLASNVCRGAGHERVQESVIRAVSALQPSSGAVSS